MARRRRYPVQPASDIFEDIVTVKEAARRSNYSLQNVYLLADTGRIIAHQYGRTWLIYYPSLARYCVENSLRPRS